MTSGHRSKRIAWPCALLSQLAKHQIGVPSLFVIAMTALYRNIYDDLTIGRAVCRQSCPKPNRQWPCISRDLYA